MGLARTYREQSGRLPLLTSANRVTFICSKTDDISLMEAQESLGLDEEMGDSWLEKEEYCKKAKALNKELDQLKDSRIVYSELYNDADEKIEVWESLKSSIEDGKVCFSPKSKALNKKRKGNTSGGARKKQRRSEKDDTFDEDSEDSQESDEDIQDSSEEEESREPLTEERITEKIRELRETKREAKLQKAELADKMTSIRKEISKANAAEKKVEARMSALCISGRNQYSKGAIQHVCENTLIPLSSQISRTLLPIIRRILQQESESWTKKWLPMKMRRILIPNPICGIMTKLHVVCRYSVCHREGIRSYRGGYAKIRMFQVSKQ